MKAALINVFNIVENVIVWDETCAAPEGMTLVILDDDDIVSPGWVHNDGKVFVDPSPPPAPAPAPAPAPQPTLSDLQAQLATLTNQIQALAGAHNGD